MDPPAEFFDPTQRSRHVGVENRMRGPLVLSDRRVEGGTRDHGKVRVDLLDRLDGLGLVNRVDEGPQVRDCDRLDALLADESMGLLPHLGGRERVDDAPLSVDAFPDGRNRAPRDDLFRR
jgi:hypothetical protein